MIPAEVADIIRYVDAVLCLALAVLSGWSIVLTTEWDQRLRFVVFAAFAFLLTSGHLDSLGQPASPRLAALAFVVAAGGVGSGAYVRKEIRAREARGRRAR